MTDVKELSGFVLSCRTVFNSRVPLLPLETNQRGVDNTLEQIRSTRHCAIIFLLKSSLLSARFYYMHPKALTGSFLITCIL